MSANDKIEIENSETAHTSHDSPKEDTTVKFKIGSNSESVDDGTENQEVTFREQPTAGRNYGRSSSQETQINGTKPRQLAAIVHPNMHPSQRLKKIPSNLSLSGMGKPKVQQGKNGMVLQLVLPNGLQNGIPNSMSNGGISYEPNFSEAVNDGLKRRKPESMQNMSPQNSLVFNYGNTGAVPGSYDYGSNMDSFKGAETVVSEAISHITPTPQEEKERVTREFTSIQYSLLYGLFIVAFGVTIYIVDVIEEQEPLKTIFSYFLVCTALLFIIYVLVDVRLYMKKRQKYIDTLENNKTHDIDFLEHPEGGIHLSIPLPEASTLQKPLPHYYCLGTGRHGGSLYLKIGAAIFCLGHLIHSGLILGYQIVYLSSDEEMWHECTTVPLLILDFIYPLYAFLLLFFIFKYSNLMISRNIVLARFGFMHCMSSGLCFWVHTILRETFDALSFYDFGTPYQNETTPTTEADDTSVPILPGKNSRMWTGICDGEEGMAVIYQNFSPYLYPFSVEFNILMVGMLYIVWDTIGSCKQNFEHNDKAAELARDCASDFHEEPEKESNLTIHVDCHSSSRGIFSGILVVIVLIVAIILFFVAINDERFQEMGLTINRSTLLVINLIMAIVVVWSYFYTTKLDVNHHHISPLDDALLYICVPMFYLNLIFSMAAAVYFGNGLYIAFLLVETIQVVIQTSFIVDGLRRCSNSRETRKKKPGRELIVFLIITNAALWVTMTFEVSSSDTDDRYEFYGIVVWSILGHVWLPLMMFYRFHASACLADMWKYCYEKASH